ncbi:MAG TPA: SMC family ATPase [Methanophagales archaeon]|nr:SMC family ATPase [Methanophagales archaeon]
MLLKTLTLRNYRKYKNVYVEIPDGVIGIIGLNGVGKTTLIESIGWVLFGHHAARTTKELIKREGAAHNEPCSVALEFELDGDAYKVAREMVGKNLVPKASLVINGKQITTNADKVTGVIEDRIGMDYQSFFTSVFARQKELNALSIMKAAERKKLVLRMLGIERIEKSIQAIREDKRGKEKRIEGIKTATVDEDGVKKIEVLKSKNEELEKLKEKLIPSIKELETAKGTKDKETTVAKEELETATKKYEQYMELSNTMGARRSDLENTKKRKEEKEKELKDLITKKKRLDGLADKETHYFQFRAKKEELDALREKYQRKHELLKREEKTTQEIARREGELKGLNEEISGFEGIDAAFEAQMQHKDAMEVLREKYQQKVELTRQKDKTMQEIRARESRTKRLIDDRTEFAGLEERLETMKQRLEELRKQKESLHSSIGALKSSALDIKKDVNERIAKRKNIVDLGPEGECPMCERQLGSHYEGLLTKLNEEIEAKKRNYYSSYNEYKSKKEELVSKTREEESLNKADTELDTQITKKRALDVKIEHEEKELNVWHAELKGILTALKPFEEVKFDEKLYKEVIAKLNELEKKVSAKKELEVKITHERRELARWSKELEQIKADLTPVMAVEFDNKAYKSVITTLQDLEVVYREIIGLRAEIERAKEVKDNLQLLSKLEIEITADITALKRQMDDLAFDKMAFVALKAGYDRKMEELNELKLKLMERKNEFENVCRDIEHVLADIAEQKRLLADKAKEETEIMYLSLLERMMNDFKVYMVGMIRPMLSDYASDMLRRLTDGKYSKLELDENYDVFIYDEGTSYEINRFSGGEEDLANLCLRLAISAVVSERSAIQTNFIILDEIFGSQDALRKRNIITALNELSKKFRQIFLITHIEEVKDYMEYVLRVTEDEEGVSWVEV